MDKSARTKLIVAGAIGVVALLVWGFTLLSGGGPKRGETAQTATSEEESGPRGGRLTSPIGE